ncbi:MAG: hypothetical protein WC980_10725 [Candidatus Brocadiia bacterium]
MSERSGQEVIEKVKNFADEHKDHFASFNSWYKMYRAQPDARSIGRSNTFIPEITTEIEALSTAVFEMIFSDTSDASFFDVYPQGYDDAVKSFLAKSVMSDQFETIELQRKIMPFLRGLTRDGYAPIEVPWVLDYGWKKQNGVYTRFPKFDSFDFQYIRPCEFSCGEGADMLEGMEWTCRTYIIPFGKAKRMEKLGLWQNVDKAASNGSPFNETEKARRAVAGLTNEPKEKFLKYHEYTGYLEDEDEDFRWRVMVADNGVVLREPEVNPYDDGEYPFIDCKWIECDNELYGMGVVEVNYRQQKEINDRRNFINDNLYAALYNMWAMSSDCGLKSDNGRLVWEAYKVLEMDNPSGLSALRPPLEGIPYAKQLEETDREAMRRQSGATSTLQGISQNMTATESQIVQNEATRRLRAIVRSQIGTFLKRFLYKAHSRNLQFLDRSRVIRAEGPEGEQLFASVNNNSLSRNPDFKMKISTDLDFRVFQKKELLEFLQGFAMLAKTNGFNMDAKPIIQKLALSFNMNPNDFKREIDVQRAMTQPGTIKAATQSMIAKSPGAQRIMERGAPTVGGMGIARNNERSVTAGLP